MSEHGPTCPGCTGNGTVLGSSFVRPGEALERQCHICGGSGRLPELPDDAYKRGLADATANIVKFLRRALLRDAEHAAHRIERGDHAKEPQ